MKTFKIEPKFGRGRGAGSYHAFDDVVCVFILKHGDIRLSQATFEAMGQPKHVFLLSDGNGNIGLRNAHDNAPEAYTVGHANAPKGENRIAARHFIKKHGLAPTDGALKYSAYIDDDGDLVVNTKQRPQKI